MALALLAMPAVVSASPITYTAVIEVHRTDNNGLLGYIGKDALGGTQSGYKPNNSDALQVHFTLDSALSSGSGLDLFVDNANFSGGYPLLGLVQGRDSADSTMQAGSFHYGYIATTNQTPANSTPQLVGNSYVVGAPRTSESAVWTIDVLTGAIVPVWTNPDGNAAIISLFTQSTGLYFGGDPNAFSSKYPAPIALISLKLDILSQSQPETVPEPTTMVLLGTGLLGIVVRGRSKA